MRQLIWLLSFVLFLTACGGGAEQTQEAAIPLEACRLAQAQEAECGVITVPENREAADGRTLDIHFAVIPAAGSVNEPDPIFMLAGGPGQSAMEAFPFILSALNDLNRERDIVLVDQRGTGQSNPLACPNVEELALDSSDADYQAALDACRRDLAADNDLSQYTTAVAMTDLDEVRQALGYEQINLIGASYGSRAALTYMRLYPDRVRTAVLNAVAGPELVLQLQMPRDGQRALDLFFARCAADEACQSAFPDLEAEFQAVLRQLEGGTAVRFTHPVTGEAEEVSIDRDDFMQIIFNLLYSPELVSLLPLQIHQAALSGDVGPIIAQGLAFVGGVDLYQGMFYAVTCSEDAPLIDMAEAEALQAGTEFGLPADDFVTGCAEWPRAEVPAELRQPLQSDIPTLLLSGGSDPVTPPQYAEEVAETLANGRHLIIPDYGHDVLLVGCMPDVVESFIETASPADLDAACLDEIQPPPFFLSPTGPNP